MIELNNRWMHFSADPEQGAFHLEWAQGAPRVQQARLRLVFQRGAQRFEVLAEQWPVTQVCETYVDSSPHGPYHQVEVRTGRLAEAGVEAELTFALCEAAPFFLWKIKLHNLEPQPLWVERLELLRAGKHIPGSQVSLGAEQGPLAFYANGWQSWSVTAAYSALERPLSSRLGPLQDPMVINAGTPRAGRPGVFAADFYGVLGDRGARKGLLLGFLAQKEQFGTLEANLNGEASLTLWAHGDHTCVESGCSMSSDWAAACPLGLDERDPLGPYLAAVARENHLDPLAEAPVGWCSWYQYYQKLTADQVRDNLAALFSVQPELPLRLVQIDDGFESQVGDWFTFSQGFREGVAPLAKEIRAAGYTPGLWLAPFILHPKAQVVKNHPDWVLRTPAGRPVNGGFVWNALTTALDLSHPDALEYACKVIDTAAHRWGFPYLKLDFLYAAALPGQRHDPTRTRAQILRAGLEALRRAAGKETFLLGCGVPLGSAVGIFDAMRIGPDVAGNWTPKQMGITRFFRNEPHMPSARNSIQNILTRAPLHQRWWVNDPDCLLVRPDTELTLAEVQSLASVIALTGGSLLVSDDLPALPAERRRIAEVLLPVIRERVQVIDWMDQRTPQRLRLDFDGPTGPWQVIAWFNWSDHPLDFAFDPADYHLQDQPFWARSFWEGKLTSLDPGERFVIPEVAAHGAVVLALRKRLSGRAHYLGSNLHISQGLELAGFDATPNTATLNTVMLRFVLPRRCAGEVDVYLPAAPRQAKMGETPVEHWEISPNCYRFPVQIEGLSRLRIEM